MNIVKSINVPFYTGLRLHFRVLENFDDFVLQKWPGDFSDRHDAEKTHAMAQFTWPDAWLVFRNGDITHDAIAHENQHLTLKILRDVGIIESRDSEEAFCYFTGWLANYVYSTLQKNNVKVGTK